MLTIIYIDMGEDYKFSGDIDPFKKLALAEEEVRAITELGLTPEDLSMLLNNEPFGEGSYALVFELPNIDLRLVAKVWKNPRDDFDRANNENIALRLLRIRGSKNAPKIKSYLEPSKILFEEKIEGDPVEQFDEAVIQRLAIALADLHSVKLNKYGKLFAERKKGSRMDYLHDEIGTLRKLALSFENQNNIVALVIRLLDKIESQADKYSESFSGTNFTLIHFDLNKGNILNLQKEKGLAIIDWEQASAGDNAMDIAKLFLKSEFDASQKQEFLAQYESALSEEDPYLERRIQIYELFVLVNSILWRLSVLKNVPQQASSKLEADFYNRVKINLNKELETLQSSLS